MTLKHDNQASFSLSHPNSPEVTYTDVRFEICQSGYGGWQPITGNRWTARIAGTFNVRALAKADGEPITVGPVTVWVQFPSEEEMMADPVIQAHATNLWAQTLALCTPTNRQEVGCWILLNTATDTYSFTATTNGPPTPNDRTAEVNLLPVPADTPIFPHLANGAATYVVASFHTHTPMTYVVGDSRVPGPSANDINASSVLQMPGLVYDYDGNDAQPPIIPIGHPKQEAAHLYPTDTCPRRLRQ